MKKVILAIGLLVGPLVVFAQQPGTRPNQTTTAPAPGTNNSGASHLGNRATASSPANGTAGTDEDLMRQNREGMQAVSAIQPTSAKLSNADQDLMREVAMGGMMQLEMSRAVVSRTQNERVRRLAQAEIDEQTALSEKLKAIAQAKGVGMPASTDAAGRDMTQKLASLSGQELDQYYLRESGVRGHEKLDRTMEKVKSRATDANLKALAEAAHPLVKTHLQLARNLAGSTNSTMTNPGR
jgi:putative membrane protein